MMFLHKKIYIQAGLTACLVLLSVFSFSKDTKEVKGVRGEFSFDINSDINFVQAKNKALEQAKLAALKAAGIKELISSTEVLSKLSGNDDGISQLYSSFTSAESKGEVLSYTILNDPAPVKVAGNVYRTEVLIDAEVIVYTTETDPSFDFEVKGIELSYKEGKSIEFDFQSFKDAYLHVFVIEQSTMEVSWFYPNSYEPVQVFNKKNKYKFPLNNQIEYSLDTNVPIEKHDLLFVITKQERVYTGGETMQGFVKWLYSIAPDQRAVKYFNVLVTK